MLDIPPRMKAKRVHRSGPPEVIAFEELERPLADARRAHELLGPPSRRPRGKIVLVVGG